MVIDLLNSLDLIQVVNTILYLTAWHFMILTLNVRDPILAEHPLTRSNMRDCVPEHKQVTFCALSDYCCIFMITQLMHMSSMHVTTRKML